MAERKKPMGQPVELPEAASDEAATPDARTMEGADALARLDPVLASLWNAEPYDEDAD